MEAESVSYAVCQYFGIETAENSFGYIAAWSQGKELKELRASLETINKISSELITGIEKHYREICKERGIQIETQEQDTSPEVLPRNPHQKLHHLQHHRKSRSRIIGFRFLIRPSPQTWRNSAGIPSRICTRYPKTGPWSCWKRMW